MEFRVTIISIVIFLSVLLYNILNTNINSDLIQEIEDTKYPFENHTVVTTDGYILTLLRIPYDRYKTHKDKRRTPVLVIHGLVCSFADFFSFDTNGSLPYLLADQGYDVWLGNVRGTKWSRKHKFLDADIDKAVYWNFSFHEIGLTDVPALIDYILIATKHQEMHYIGYSQGTAAIIILLSEKPEYNRKVKFISAMAPGVFLGESKSSLIKFLGRNVHLWEKITNFLGVYEISSATSFLSKFLKYTCKEGFILNKFCFLLLDAVSGPSNKQVNKTFQKWIENFPSGASVKQISHYLHNFNRDNFHKFNYDENKNLQLYNQTTPSLYDFEKVLVPVAVYYSKDDYLTSERANKRLITMLPNVVKTVFIEENNFNHFSFMSCRSAVELCYKPLIEEMNKH